MEELKRQEEIEKRYESRFYKVMKLSLIELVVGSVLTLSSIFALDNIENSIRETNIKKSKTKQEYIQQVSQNMVDNGIINYKRGQIGASLLGLGFITFVYYGGYLIYKEDKDLKKLGRDFA